MNSRQNKTLAAIFTDPVKGNMAWKEIETLLIALNSKVSNYSAQSNAVVGVGIGIGIGIENAGKRSNFSCSDSDSDSDPDSDCRSKGGYKMC